MGWVVNATPRPLYLPVPTVQEDGWGPSTGLDACGKTRLPLGFEPPDRSGGCSESLYRLSYPDPLETHHVYTNAVNTRLDTHPAFWQKHYATPRVKHKSEHSTHNEHLTNNTQHLSTGLSQVSVQTGNISSR